MKNIKILALTLLTYGNAASVDYKTNGDNWPDSFSGCKGGTQSPINLKSTATTVDGKGDFFKFYSNLKSKQVKWNPDKSTNYATVNTDAGTLTPN